MTNESASSTTVQWMEPCWCCGALFEVKRMDTDGYVEMEGRCEPCESYWPATRVIARANGNIETCPDRFDPATWYEHCTVHGKERGDRRPPRNLQDSDPGEV
jgi:hypothetical protein